MGGLSWLLLTEQPGLRVDLFPLDPNWQGEPVPGGIGEPQIGSREEVDNLVSKEIFSARWRGWLWVDRSGDYLFHIDADEERYLSLDGVRYSEGTASLTLKRGPHPIEVGFNQTRRQARLQTLWAPTGEDLVPVPAELLFDQRPLYPSRVLRRSLAPFSKTLRHILGATLLLAGVLTLGKIWPLADGGSTRLIDTNQAPDQRTVLQLTLLASLFVACWLWTSRFVTPLMGGDDVLYLHKALFPAKGQWFYNRYIHIYLLKLFVWLREGDGFLGSRTYFSFVSSVTVSALAVACSSLGPRLQLRTLAVTLFLLASQTTLMGRACGAFADFSCMMFVTVAVAVYLHEHSRAKGPGRFGWHHLAIGALTVAACKSKETGIILLWLPLLFLWSQGRFDLRGFLRKMAFWTAGLLGAWIVLMALDAWILGDLWYSVTPDLAAMKRLHVTQEMQLERSITRWMLALWSRDSPASEQALRYLWLLALATPVVTLLKRKGIELTILFVMPLAYLMLLIAVHARAPHIFSTRYFFTILPVCCLAAGALLNYLGLEERSWREILRPQAFVPLFIASAAVLIVLNPIRLGQIDLSPAATHFAIWLSALVAVTGTVALLRTRSWVAIMAILLLLLFGPSFQRVQQTSKPRLLAQRGDLILYPWQIFQREIQSVRPETIVVPPELWRVYNMVGQKKTREQIAQIFFHRQDLRMWQHREIDPEVDLAIAAPDIFKSWRRQIPGLRETAVYDPSGRFALVRPRQAMRSAAP